MMSILFLFVNIVFAQNVVPRVSTSGFEKITFQAPEESSKEVQSFAKKIKLEILAKIKAPGSNLTPTKTLIKDDVLYISYMTIGEETRGAIDAYDLKTNQLVGSIQTNTYEFLDLSDSFTPDQILAGGQIRGIGAALIYISLKPSFAIKRHDTFTGYFVTSIQKQSDGYTIYSSSNGGKYLYNKNMEQLKYDANVVLDSKKASFGCGEVFAMKKDSSEVERSVGQVVRKSKIPGLSQDMWTDKSSEVYIAQSDGGLWIYDACNVKKFLGFYGRNSKPYFFTANSITVNKISTAEKLVIVSDKNNTYIIKETRK